jgi:flagella basal body P-ring formation protein FlgA
MTAVIGLVLALAFAAPAMAAQSVELRPDAAAHGGRVTLADLFDGAGAAGDVTLATGVQPGGQVVLGAGRVQAAAAAHGLDWANPQGLKVVILMADVRPASLLAEAPAGAAAAREAGALTWARTLQAGEVVQPDDLVWARAVAPPGAPREPRVLLGQAARRQLRAGDAASFSDVTAPQVIRKDDVVQVTYEAEGMKLTLEGRAVTGAALGQNVSVLNPASKKTIEAVASGPGQALVGPEADRLKAAARANPALYASLR